jgi:hypothetical protein
MYAEASVDQVRVIDGSKYVEVTFTVDGYTGESIDVELTLAKWLPDDGTWINMLQRAVGPGEGTTVVRAGNLRLAQADSGCQPCDRRHERPVHHADQEPEHRLRWPGADRLQRWHRLAPCG